MFNTSSLISSDYSDTNTFVFEFAANPRVVSQFAPQSSQSFVSVECMLGFFLLGLNFCKRKATEHIFWRKINISNAGILLKNQVGLFLASCEYIGIGHHVWLLLH